MLAEPAGRFTLRPLEGSSDVLAHALTYAHQGLSVILIHAPLFGETGTTCSCKNPDCRYPASSSVGKHPIDRGWQSGAPADESTLRDRFARLKFTPNLGIVLGPQGDGTYLVAVDIDIAERAAALELELGELPTTVTSASARGERMLYSLPQGTPESRVRNITGLGGAPGVDVKAARGQIVVPPSFHASGAEYRWTTAGEVADLPAAWVLALLGPPVRPPWAAEYTPTLLKDDRRSRNRAEKYLQSAVLAEAGLVARCGEGLRNSTLHGALCRLLPLAHGLGLPSGHGYVVRELSSGARSAGLGEREVRSTVASAERWLRESGAVRVLPHEAARGNGRSSEAPAPIQFARANSSTSTENNYTPSPEHPSVLEGFPPVPPGGAALLSLSFDDPGPDVELLQENNSPAKCAENVARLLARHPEWRGGPALNGLTGRFFWPGVLPGPVANLARHGGSLLDVDEIEIQGWLLAQPFEHRVKASAETVHAGVVLASHRRRVDPLLERFAALPAWDGVPRLGNPSVPSAVGWLTTLAGVDDTPVVRLFSRRWLLSAVARAHQPGCVADGVLILVGDQGIGKNRLLSTLFGEAPYVESLGSYRLGHDVEADQLAGSCWVVHDDEMGGRRSNLDALKAWVSRREDTYRPKYGRNLVTTPRRAVLACSTNRATFLEDETNRRFWPVQCGAIDIPRAERDRDQLFAEALVVYRGLPAGHPLATSLGGGATEPWTIGPQDELWTEVAEVQDSRRAVDAIEENVRLAVLRLGSPRQITVAELAAALSVPPERQDRALEMRLGAALRCLTYCRTRLQVGRHRIYAYLKDN